MLYVCLALPLTYSPLDVPENDLPLTVIPNYPHEITKGYMATTIPLLPKQFEVTFDFQASRRIGGWSNILHMTTGGNSAWGERIPGFFPLNDKIAVSFSVDGNGNWNFMTPTISLNKWIHMKVNQQLEGKNYVYRVYMDGKLLKEVHQPMIALVPRVLRYVIVVVICVVYTVL